MKNLKSISIAIILVMISFVSFAGKTSKIMIKTSGQCGMCKTTIEATVKAIDGTSSAYYNEANSKVLVKYDAAKTNPDAIRQAISKAGYDADNVMAVKAAHDALPKCCQKGQVCTDGK
jgi:copper chaperone CopZ